MTLNAWFDGSYGSRQHIASWGYLVKDENGTVIKAASGSIMKGWPASSLIGEYEALYQAMLWISQNHPEAEVVFRGDASLVIDQMNGDAKAKKGVYLPWFRKARALAAGFCAKEGPLWRFQWIRRGMNSEADELSAYRF